MENLDASWKSGMGASWYLTAVGSVGMGARVLVEEVLEDDLLVLVLVLLLFEPICEDAESFVEVFTVDTEEDFAEVIELVFLLIEEDTVEDFEGDFAETLLEGTLAEDFAEVLVLVFLLVEEELTEFFEELLAASCA